MIPLYSDAKLSRFPFVTVTLILASIAAFFYEIWLTGSLNATVWRFGVIPAELLTPGPSAIPGRLPEAATLITGLFTHGGILHLASNMLYLWVFGRDVEDDFGHFRFLVFYLGCGLAASAGFVGAFPKTAIPLVGASGAIAGVLGAYFLRFPLRKIATFVIIRIVYIPGILFLGLWFFIQFYSCSSDAIAGAASQGGVAWLAHIAGFVMGMLWTILILRERYYRRRS